MAFTARRPTPPSSPQRRAIEAYPTVTDLTGGGWVVTWQSNQSGTNDIYQSVYAADGSLMQKAGGGAVADQAVVSAAPSLQVNPTVTALSGGGWVVTWQSFQSGTYDIYQSVYAADGSVVVDQAVVSAAAGHQGHPTVTGLDGGGWVVTWASNQSGSYHVYQSVYAADGSVVVDQAVVSAAAADPTVTALSGGGWVVTWASDQSGSYHVYQSVYAADGSVVVDQAVVSAAAGYQAYPTVTGLDGGGWVVAWTSSQSGTPDIYQSVYAADGSLMQKLGGGFVAKEAVVSAAANDQSLPTVTALSGGGWVVAVADQANVTHPLGSEGTKGAMFPAVAAVDGGWVVAWEYGGSPGTFGVYQSVYASDGSLKEKSAGGGVIAEKAVVSDGILSDQRNPAVATFGEGWIVVWRSNEASTSRIFQTIYDKDGNPSSLANNAAPTPEASFLNISVTVLAGGGWVVTWHGNGPLTTNSDVRQTVFKPDGSILLNSCGCPIENVAVGPVDLTQQNSEVTALSDGGWVVTWESNHNGSDRIYQSVYAADGSVVIDTDLVSNQSGSHSPSVTALAGGGWVIAWDWAGDIHQRVFGVLTKLADTATGGDDADTLAAKANMLTAGDTIDGGKGDDELALVGGGTFDFTGVALSKVEKISGGDDPDTLLVTNETIEDVKAIDGQGGYDTLTLRRRKFRPFRPDAVERRENPRQRRQKRALRLHRDACRRRTHRSRGRRRHAAPRRWRYFRPSHPAERRVHRPRQLRWRRGGGCLRHPFEGQCRLQVRTKHGGGLRGLHLRRSARRTLWNRFRDDSRGRGELYQALRPVRRGDISVTADHLTNGLAIHGSDGPDTLHLIGGRRVRLHRRHAGRPRVDHPR